MFGCIYFICFCVLCCRFLNEMLVRKILKGRFLNVELSCYLENIEMVVFWFFIFIVWIKLFYLLKIV